MNLTDEQIIKALEYCFSHESLDDCGDCPLTKMCDNDPFYTEKISLDLINRQKAEIEKLKKIEHFADKTIEKQSAEIERLKDKSVRIYGCVRFIKGKMTPRKIKKVKKEVLKDIITSIKNMAKADQSFFIINHEKWGDPLSRNSIGAKFMLPPDTRIMRIALEQHKTFMDFVNKHKIEAVTTVIERLKQGRPGDLLVISFDALDKIADEVIGGE